jgi:hypothetical protein
MPVEWQEDNNEGGRYTLQGSSGRLWLSLILFGTWRLMHFLVKGKYFVQADVYTVDEHHVTCLEAHVQFQ